MRRWYPATARSIPCSRAYCPVRSGSRPATAAATPPARRSPGRKAARAMLAVPMIPQRTAPVPVIFASVLPLVLAGVPGPGGPGWRVQRKAHPAALVVRDLHGVDDFLPPQAVAEVSLVAVKLAEHLAGEVRRQVRVVQRPPRFSRAAARRVVLGGDLDLPELHIVGLRDLQRLADAEFLDQPGDGRARAAVDAHLDARVVADRDEAGLHRAERAAGELPDEHVGVVD